MKNYAVLSDLRVKTALHIEKAFDRGYEQGYNDCRVELLDDEAKCHYQEGYNEGYAKGIDRGRESRITEADCTYQCGIEKAWDAARKVMLSPEEGAIDSGTVKEIFGMNYYAVLKNLPVDEVISKIDAWEKKQERHCYNCGQPRDYKDFCIPYKEGKCDKSHKAWIPKQEQTEKSCEKCKWMELDCANPEICKDMALYEPKDIEEDVKVGDTIRTIKDKDYLNIELFPIGTIGRVIKIESEDNFLRYKVRVGNECWLYSRDMFEVINQDAPEMNVGNIENRDKIVKAIAGLLAAYGDQIWDVMADMQKSK